MAKKNAENGSQRFMRATGRLRMILGPPTAAPSGTR